MEQALQYIRMLRVQDWILGYFFIPVIGSIAAIGISPLLLVTAAVSFSILAFGFVINNVSDTEIDRCHAGKCQENKNPLAASHVTLRGSWCLTALLAGIPLIIAWLSNPPAFLFVSCTLVLFAAYSIPPFRLKERYLIDILTHGIMAGALLFFIGYTLPRPDVPVLSPGPLALAALFTGIGCIALVVHQIGDYEEDCGTTMTTIVRMGKTRGWILLSLLFLLSMVCLAIVHLVISLELWVLLGSLALFAIPVFLLRNEIRKDFFPGSRKDTAPVSADKEQTGPGDLYSCTPHDVPDTTMTARILVAYATRNGSTAEIAQAVGRELEKSGAAVTVADMKTVGSLAGYTAVVLGGPLYMGSMEKTVRLFVAKYLAELTEVPVAAFAVGLAPKDPRPEAVGFAMESLKKAVSPISPVSMVLFTGKLDPAKLNFLMRKFMAMAKIPSGDFRDWDAIAAWAHELTEKMQS